MINYLMPLVDANLVSVLGDLRASGNAVKASFKGAFTRGSTRRGNYMEPSLTFR